MRSGFVQAVEHFRDLPGFGVAGAEEETEVLPQCAEDLPCLLDLAFGVQKGADAFTDLSRGLGGVALRGAEHVEHVAVLAERDRGVAEPAAAVGRLVTA
ncbi:hypothetical protein GCM10017673_28880 [Streptosporangium violaceochromogenes]|nr:hypothetical protein GCM10017673_28880 [Streptosporangium violaceochromogenes]